MLRCPRRRVGGAHCSLPRLGEAGPAGAMEVLAKEWSRGGLPVPAALSWGCGISTPRKL